MLKNPIFLKPPNSTPTVGTPNGLSVDFLQIKNSQTRMQLFSAVIFLFCFAELLFEEQEESRRNFRSTLQQIDFLAACFLNKDHLISFLDWKYLLTIARELLSLANSSGHHAFELICALAYPCCGGICMRKLTRISVAGAESSASWTFQRN